jgi:Na+-driven multidrug efflux pump
MLVIYVPIALVLWQVMGNHGLWLAIYVMMILRAGTLLARWPALIRDVGS